MLTILLDIPSREVRDNPNWRDSRLIAYEWKTMLAETQIIFLDENWDCTSLLAAATMLEATTFPEDFRNTQNAIHIDRIYIPEVQNQVEVGEVVFEYSAQKSELIIQNGEYVI